MEEIYANVVYELYNIKHDHDSDVCDHTDLSVRKRNISASKESLKFLLVALGLLLLCALVGICVLGILYYNKVISFQSLNEQYTSVVFKISAQEHNATECQKCEAGWRYFGLKCYYFSADKLNWMNSRDYCAENGAHLVIITSQDEQTFVSSSIREQHWIGLNDLEMEGKWMWVNNKPLTVTGVKFWHKHITGTVEPDNWTSEDPSGEDCGSLGNGRGFTDDWFDDSCLKLKKYICEK